jgi:hypothetical protein
MAPEARSPLTVAFTLDGPLELAGVPAIGTKADLVFETLKTRLIAGWRGYGDTLNTL